MKPIKIFLGDVDAGSFNGTNKSVNACSGVVVEGFGFDGFLLAKTAFGSDWRNRLPFFRVEDIVIHSKDGFK